MWMEILVSSICKVEKIEACFHVTMKKINIVKKLQAYQSIHSTRIWFQQVLTKLSNFGTSSEANLLRHTTLTFQLITFATTDKMILSQSHNQTFLSPYWTLNQVWTRSDFSQTLPKTRLQIFVSRSLIPNGFFALHWIEAFEFGTSSLEASLIGSDSKMPLFQLTSHHQANSLQLPTWTAKPFFCGRTEHFSSK
jgi:hypothetical protein